jgi:hypothetical protein
MEDYYSGAYYTIVASRSGGSRDGFLKPRPGKGPKARLCYPLSHGIDHNADSTLYIYSAIDDFARDVERGNLSTRGWVYQERALSRRIIHFTETQAYWECGRGIRCETMTKLFK